MRKGNYITPQIEVIEVENEGVMASSSLAHGAYSNGHKKDIVPPSKEDTDFILRATMNGASTSKLRHTPHPSEGLKVVWTDGSRGSKKDAFNVYGTSAEDAGIEFTLKTLPNGGGSATFEGEQLSNGTYTALYPSWRCRTKRSELLLDMTNQRQATNNDTTHLADYNYMTSSITISAPKEAPELSFKHRIAIIQLYVKLPDEAVGEKVNQISVEVSGEVNASNGFQTAVNLDGTNPVYSSKMALAVDNAALNDDNTFTAYLAILPSVLNSNGLTLTVNTSGKTYRSTTAINKSYHAGTIYSNTNAVVLTFDGKEVGDVVTAADTFGRLAGQSGDGWGASDTDPYLIEDAEQLQKLIEQYDEADYKGKYYRLMTNFHITATAWTPIGGKYNWNMSKPIPFEGTFDGNGHTISGNLVRGVNRDGGLTDEGYNGFFGAIKGNTTIKKLHISANVIQSKDWPAGRLVGYGEGSSLASLTLEGCSCSGNLMSQSDHIGGLVGEISLHSI